MNHAFLILTHRSPQQTLTMAKRISAPNRRLFIHWDKKTALDESDPALRELRMMERVELIDDRVNVQWGSFRLIEAILKMMSAALKHKDLEYLHLLSIECLPVKSAAYFDRFFTESGRKEWVRTMPMPAKRTFGWGPNRYDKWHLHEYFNPRSKALRDVFIRNLNSFLRKGQRVLKPVGIYRRYPRHLPPVQGGPAWWSLTRECCAYILKYIDEHPDFVRRFRHTQLPDESFFQTIIMASPFAERVANDNLRYDFFNKGGSFAQPLTMNNAEALKAPNVLIARKFTDESSELLAHLAQTME